jgi:hypothetical protein
VGCCTSTSCCVVGGGGVSCATPSCGGTLTCF